MENFKKQKTPDATQKVKTLEELKENSELGPLTDDQMKHTQGGSASRQNIHELINKAIADLERDTKIKRDLLIKPYRKE